MRRQGDKEARRELRPEHDVLDVLKDELGRFDPAIIPGLPRFMGGAVGYLSYDTVRFYEELPTSAETILPFPDAVFLITDNIVAFDHARHRLMIMSNARIGDDVEASYMEAVSSIERITEKLLRPLPAVPTRIYASTSGKLDRVTKVKQNAA